MVIVIVIATVKVIAIVLEIAIVIVIVIAMVIVIAIVIVTVIVTVIVIVIAIVMVIVITIVIVIAILFTVRRASQGTKTTAKNGKQTAAQGRLQIFTLYNCRTKVHYFHGPRRFFRSLLLGAQMLHNRYKVQVQPACK